MRIMLLVLCWDILIEFDGLKPEIDVDTTDGIIGVGAALDWS